MFLIHDLGIDHVVLFRLSPRSGLTGAWLASTRLVRRSAVELGRYGLPGLIEPFASRFNGRWVTPFERFFGGGNGVFDFPFVRFGNLPGVVTKHFLRAIHRAVSLIACFDFLSFPLVLFSMQ